MDGFEVSRSKADGMVLSVPVLPYVLETDQELYWVLSKKGALLLWEVEFLCYRTTGRQDCLDIHVELGKRRLAIWEEYAELVFSAKYRDRDEELRRSYPLRLKKTGESLEEALKAKSKNSAEESALLKKP